MSKRTKGYWMDALVDARSELHHTDEYGNRWDVWNEIEDFFWVWIVSVHRES